MNEQRKRILRLSEYGGVLIEAIFASGGQDDPRMKQLEHDPQWAEELRQAVDGEDWDKAHKMVEEQVLVTEAIAADYDIHLPTIRKLGEARAEALVRMDEMMGQVKDTLENLEKQGKVVFIPVDEDKLPGYPLPPANGKPWLN